ncbi:MAG: hypothetical protein R6V20_10545 [Desulfobia sp.]
MTKTAGRVLTVLFLAALLIRAVDCPALTALPDLGINYRRMKIEQPETLRNLGMKDVHAGDRVKVNMNPEKELVITNQRTGESLVITRGKSGN